MTTHIWYVPSIGDAETPEERERFITAAQDWLTDEAAALAHDISIDVRDPGARIEGLFRVRSGVSHGPRLHANEDDPSDQIAFELTERVWQLYCDNDLPGIDP